MEIKEEIKEETLVTEEVVVEEKSAEDILYSKPEEELSKDLDDKTTDEEKKLAESEDKENQDKEDGEDQESAKETEYKLELKEKSLLDNAFVEDVKALATEHNLTSDQAQKLLSNQEESVQKWVDSQLDEVEQQKETWKDQVIEDKAIGGANLEATVNSARGVLDKFASEDVKAILRDSGYGNHPEIVRFLSKVGKAMSDDSLIMPKAKETPISIEEIFYGSQN